MSFESAKKMGFTASLIAVIVPVVMGIVYVGLLVSILNSILTSVFTAVPGLSNASPFASSAFMVAIIALAAVAIAGFVLFMIAMSRLSHYYGEPGIFKNLLYALVIQIVVAAVFVVGAVLFSFFAASNPFLGSAPTTSVTPVFFSFFILILVVGGVGVAIGIVCALLYKRAFDKLAERSGVDNFKTAGLLYLIGVVLSIVFIGPILIWIAWIFAALGYHKLTPAATNTYNSTPTTAPATGALKRCPICGADNAPDAIFCRNCGRQL